MPTRPDFEGVGPGLLLGQTPPLQKQPSTARRILMILGAPVIFLVCLATVSSGPVIPERGTAVAGNLSTIETCLMAYKTKAGSYPTTEQGLQALITRPESQPRPDQWEQIFDEVPHDPWGHAYVYVQPGVRNPSGYDLYSVGKDGQPNTDDDIWP